MSQIPQRKHSKDELADLRARKAMQMAGQEVVNPYEQKLAKTPVIILGYLCALVAPLYLIVLKMKSAYSYEMTDLKIMAVGAILAILIAIFIFLTRSLSRHHASFMVIIALISSFSMVYLVNQDKDLKREVMVMFGQEVTPEKSEADKIVDDLIKEAESNRYTTETPALPEKEKIILTPEEKEEMKRMFAPGEAEVEKRSEMEQRMKELEELKESNEDSE